MRRPAAAGSFYSGSAAGLRQQIEECFGHRIGPGALPTPGGTGPRRILGLVSPHAGYIYSGPVAAHGFFHLASEGKPEVVVILGPNHRSAGATVGVSKESEWQTPLGLVETDSEVGMQIITESRVAQWDDRSHQM